MKDILSTAKRLLSPRLTEEQEAAKAERKAEEAEKRKQTKAGISSNLDTLGLLAAEHPAPKKPPTE